MATPSGSISISATIDTSAAERDVLAALRRIEKRSTLNLNTKNFTQPLGRITGEANEFQKSLEASNARVVAFGASAGIIYNVQKAFSALISSTIEVEKSLTDINVVLNSSTKTLTQFGDQLFNVAKQTGSSFNQVTEAAIEFSRQGLSLEDTLKRTRDALILTRLAGLDVVSSTEALTSAVNSFTKEALTTTDVVNKLAAVDAKFAVSSRDLSEAIKRVGSSASEAGVSFDELLGIVTSVQQTTARGGAVIGNALKTIFTRIQRPDVINDLRDFGVAVKDLQGNSLPIIQVLENLAKSFEDLNPVVKAQVGELVGGVFQINILKAALSDLSKENSIFQAATSASNKAIDDAIVKNNALNKSITALINEASVNLTQFGKNIGNVSVGPGIKNLVGILNDNLSQINEKSGESVGAKIGAGLLKGITNFVTGPGLILGSVVLGKLFGRFATFTTDAAKGLLGLNTITQQQNKLQESAAIILKENPALLGQIITGEKTRLQVEKEIRDVLIQQSSLTESIRRTSEDFSKSFIASGMGVTASNVITSNRFAPARRTSQGFIPNFAGSLAPQMQSEVFEAKKLGAQGNVKAKLSKGTIGGKRFILNTAETELVGFGRNGDSAVIPSYGDGFNKAMQKIASGKAGSVLGGINGSEMSFGGFIPNFAKDDEGTGDFGSKQFRDYMRSIGKAYRVDKITNKQGKKVAGPLTWNLSDKNYFENFKPEELEEFEKDLLGFQKTYNTDWKPTGYSNYLRAVAFKENKITNENEGTRGKIRVPSNLKAKPKIDAVVAISTMMGFGDYLRKNYPQELSNKIEISSKLKSVNDELKPIEKILKEGGSITPEMKAKLEKLKPIQKQLFKQSSENLQKPAETFGAEYEKFAIEKLKKLGFPNIKSAAELGLFGTGGEETTDVDAVDLTKRAFFEFKAGEIKQDQSNKKFKNVRSRPENWPILLGVKFSEAFDKIKGPWQDILVSNTLREAVRKSEGNKVLRLPTEKRNRSYLYSLIDSENRPGEKATAVSPYSYDLYTKKSLGGQSPSILEQFIDEEYARIMMEKPKSYSKGFIPNFAAENLGKFKLNDRIVMAYGKKNDPESIAKYLVNIGRINPLFDKAKNPVLDSKGQQVVQFSGYTTKYGSEGYQNLIRHFRSDGVLDYRVVPSSDEKSITSYLRQIRLSDFSSGFLPNFSDGNLKDLLNVAKLKSFSSPEDLYYWLTRLSQEKGLQIKQGSSRIGIPLDDKTFLKIAANKAGLAQNFIENRILNDPSARKNYSNILPKIFASDDKRNLWNIVERLDEVGSFSRQQSEKMIGKSANSFMLLGPYSDTERQIFDFTNKYDLDPQDFFQGRNIGFTRTKNPRLKLMDIGLSTGLLRSLERNPQFLTPGRFGKGLIPNFANYTDSVMQLEKNLSGSTAILDTTTGPYPFIRNSKQANFADAVADHGGVANALKDSIKMQTAAGLLKNKGFIPNFADEGFDKFDVTLITASLFGLGTQLKQVADSFKNIKEATNAVNAALKEDVKGIQKSSRERVNELNNQFKAEKAVRNQSIDAAKQNIDSLKNQRKQEKAALDASTKLRASLGLGPDPAERTKYLSSSRAIGKQIKQQEKLVLDQENALSNSLSEATTRAKEIRNEARQSVAEKTAEAASKTSRSAKINQFIRGSGFGIGLAGAGIANVAEQFIPQQNFRARALTSGAGDILSYAGTGAAFGPYGALAGAILGAGVAAKKFVDSGFEAAIFKINKELDVAKDKANSFSNASQAYATSLEELKNALNDPKARPDTLVRFQTAIQDALGQIPDEFRQKVLNAGSDITKISQAISDVNKELGKTQQSLEAQASILEFISSKQGTLNSIFNPIITLLGGQGNAFSNTLNNKDQQTFNRLFTRNVNQQGLIKQFGSQQNFSDFINQIRGQLFTTQQVGGFSNIPSGGIGGLAPIAQQSALTTRSVINLKNLPAIEKQLKDSGLFFGDIADSFSNAVKNFDEDAISKLIKALEDVGITAFTTEAQSKNLAKIQEENVKKNRDAAEVLKVLNQQYNNLNFQLSKQIQIEQNRASTVRDINKIYSEGVINIQRSRVKNLLEAASPFITEQQRTDVQNQLDLNEVVNRQNSQIRDAIDKTLSSFNESFTAKIKEITDQIVGETTDLNKDENQITRPTSVFQRNLRTLLPLVRQGLERTSTGGNVADIQNELINTITNTATLTGGQQEVLIQQIRGDFANFLNELAKIKAQGDIDLAIQKSQNDLQRKTYEISQKLSLAGGAQALMSTGTYGVSELFDNIANLVGELRKNNTIGNSGQNISLLGSSVFKLLDVLTNQLQLNRAATSPIPNVSPESFNKAVSDQLRPLAAISIAGRTRQIRESLGLARQTTEIQLGRPIGKESPLGLAFERANQNAVESAILQISSELKLQNIGSYFDALQEETRYLNQLTEEQTKILREQAPNLQTTFTTVISEKVGSKLDTLNTDLINKLNELTITTKNVDVEKQIRDLIPSSIPFEQRANLLAQIRSKGTSNDVQYNQGRVTSFLSPNQEISKQFNIPEETIKSIVQLIESAKSFADKINANTRPNFNFFNRNQPQSTFMDMFAPGFSSAMKGQGGLGIGTQTTGANNQQVLSVPDRLKLLRGQIDSLNSQTDVYLKNNTELVRLQAEVNKILQEGVNTAEQKKKLTEVEIKLRKQELDIQLKTAKDREDLLYNTDYGRTFFREEKQAAAEARITAEARQGNVAVGSIVKSTFQYDVADAAKDTGDTLKIVLSDFKTGVASAFSEAIKGTKTLREAFADFFQSLLNRITDRASSQFVDSVLGAVQGGASAYFGSRGAVGSNNSYTQASTPVPEAIPNKNGGLIKGYNFGGLVTGGSGFRDDVPAMMSGGEFVIRQSSVKKYGANFLDQLNNGQIQTAADGGSFSVGPMRNEFVYNDPERPTSGEYSIDPRLSAFALTDENNPQNKIREQRFEELDRYLLDKDQYDKDRKKALSDFDKKVQNIFNQALIAAGIQLAAAGITFGAGKLANKGGGGQSFVGDANAGGSASVTVAKGGLIPKFAFGGPVRKLKAGGMAGRDKIPALLMGNEYVMSPEATKYYGKSLMDDLNKGTFRKNIGRTRFAEGGLVGSGSSVSYQGNAVNNNFDQLVVAINTLNESINKNNQITQSEAGGITPNFNAQGQLASSSIVNNISINVSSGNVSGTSETNSENQNQDQTQDLQNNQKLAELLKGKIVEVIVEQKRPGGLLASVKP